MKRIFLFVLFYYGTSLTVTADQLTPQYDQVELEQSTLYDNNKPVLDAKIIAQQKGHNGTLLNSVSANGRYLFSYSTRTPFIAVTTFDEQTLSWAQTREFNVKELFKETDYTNISIIKAGISESGVVILFTSRLIDNYAYNYISILRQQDDGQFELISDEKSIGISSIQKLVISGDMVAFYDYSTLYIHKIDNSDLSLISLGSFQRSLLGLLDIDEFAIDNKSKRLLISGSGYASSSDGKKSFVEYSYTLTDNKISLKEESSRIVSENDNFMRTKMYFDAQNQSYMLVSNTDVIFYQFIDDKYQQTESLSKTDFNSVAGYQHDYRNTFYGGKYYVPLSDSKIRVITINNGVASVSYTNQFSNNNNSNRNTYTLYNTSNGLVGIIRGGGLVAFTFENAQGLLSQSLLSINDRVENVLYAQYLKSLDLWFEITRDKVSFYKVTDEGIKLINSLAASSFLNGGSYDAFNNYNFSYDEKNEKLFYYSSRYYNDSVFQTAMFTLVDEKVSLAKEEHSLLNANGDNIQFSSIAYGVDSNVIIAWDYQTLNVFLQTDSGLQFLTSLQDGISNIDYIETIRTVLVKGNYFYVLSVGDGALNTFKVSEQGEVNFVNVLQDYDTFKNINNVILLDNKIVFDGSFQVSTFSLNEPSKPKLLTFSGRRNKLKFIDNSYAFDINFENELSFYILNNTTGYLNNINHLKSISGYEGFNKPNWFSTSYGIWMVEETLSYNDKRLGMRALIGLNRSPVVKKNEFEFSINEGEAFSEQLSAWFTEYDVDDELTFTSIDINNNFLINDDGQLVLNDNLVSERGNFTVVATDKQGQTAAGKVIFDLNIRPYLFNPLNTFKYTTNASVTIDFKEYFSDEQRESLSFSVDNIPEGLLLDDTGILSGSIKVKGNFNMTVIVTDYKGATTQESFTLIVSSPEPVVKEDKSSGGAILYGLLLLILVNLRKRLRINYIAKIKCF